VRFFVVQDPEKVPVAVVFHDHRDHALCCRSVRASFLSAFDAVCVKYQVSFVKEHSGADILRVVDRGVSDYNWISDVLEDLCGDYWVISDHGELNNSEYHIDEISEKYLS